MHAALPHRMQCMPRCPAPAGKRAILSDFSGRAAQRWARWLPITYALFAGPLGTQSVLVSPVHAHVHVALAALACSEGLAVGAYAGSCRFLLLKTTQASIRPTTVAAVRQDDLHAAAHHLQRGQPAGAPLHLLGARLGLVCACAAAAQPVGLERTCPTPACCSLHHAWLPSPRRRGIGTRGCPCCSSSCLRGSGCLATPRP